ncbi:MAG: efflux RND transporter periplasmic adaptor subunit [Bacteroidales bacterium]
MKSTKKVIGFVLLGLLIIGGIVFLTGIKNKGKKKSFYKTEKPEYRTIFKKTVANGSLEPRREIDIKPQVSGIIKELFVEPGDTLHKGDLIAKIMIIPDMVNLNSAESRVKRAKNSIKNIKKMYERKGQLFEKGIIPKTDYEETELSYLNAVEELNAADNNLQLIKEGQLKDSRQATNTIVRSTIDGMVLDVPVEIGRSVIESNKFNDGTTIASVADMSEIIFKGKIDETEVGGLVEGMPVKIKIGAIPNESFDATLEHISPKGTSESGVVKFEVKAEVKLRNGLFIRSGYSANADIVLKKQENVLSISEALLKFEDDKPYIEVQKDINEFERKDIKLGVSDGIYVELLNAPSIDTTTIIKKGF